MMNISLPFIKIRFALINISHSCQDKYHFFFNNLRNKQRCPFFFDKIKFFKKNSILQNQLNLTVTLASVVCLYVIRSTYYIGSTCAT